MTFISILQSIFEQKLIHNYQYYYLMRKFSIVKDGKHLITMNDLM
jgi:hypothetical protein